MWVSVAMKLHCYDQDSRGTYVHIAMHYLCYDNKRGGVSGYEAI